MRKPIVAEKFNTCRLPKAGCFADYKGKVIDLLKRVTTVRVGTMEVVRGMGNANR